jgi:glycosyltransferase involved in cell wall biosynthesis
VALMATLPEVSGIIIVHNGEAFLDEAITSVKAQTFSGWELVIVDDGSTDSSAEIARRHAAGDPRIVVVRHADGRRHGMSATRNLGLDHARGECVGFLDADDVWCPTKLEEQLEILHRHPEVGMVYGRTLIWHRWDPTSPDVDHFYDLGVTPDRVYVPTVLFRNLLSNVHQTPTTCNALLRRSVVDEVGRFEPAFESMFEDQVFFAKVLLRSPVFVSDRPWAQYRQHEHSSSALSSARGGDEAAHVRYLLWLRRYARRTGVGRVGDRLAIERALWNVRSHRIVRRTRQWAARRKPTR